MEPIHRTDPWVRAPTLVATPPAGFAKSLHRGLASRGGRHSQPPTTSTFATRRRPARSRPAAPGGGAAMPNAQTSEALLSLFDSAPLNRRYWTNFSLLALITVL